MSYTHPHEPYLCRKEFWDLYEDADIPMPNIPALSQNEHDAHAVRLLTDFGMLDFKFEDEEIMRARRAYYGSISYIDQMLGRILETLKSSGADQNTVVVFTSDHGEMLGERGMWFKKHFFEPALKVPLFIYAPWIKPTRVKTPVSLVDLLPTFCGLAKGAPWNSNIEELEGADLIGLLGEDDLDRPVYAEYLAEATAAPIFMIRRGRFKYISCSTDPSLLFDVEADPDERVNLAAQPEHAGLVARFEAEVEAKWDEETLCKNIVTSQKRRALIREALKSGSPTRWNHDESAGDKVLWYRGETTYSDWAFNYLPNVD